MPLALCQSQLMKLNNNNECTTMYHSLKLNRYHTCVICKLLHLNKMFRLPLGLPHMKQRMRQGPEEHGFVVSHDRADKLCSSEACKPLQEIPGHQIRL